MQEALNAAWHIEVWYVVLSNNLKGHQHNRLLISFANKAARVQLLMMVIDDTQETVPHMCQVMSFHQSARKGKPPMKDI